MTKEQFIGLVEQEQGPLRRFLRTLCGGDSFRADDLAQEALLKAYLSFARFEGRAQFSTWLFKIAYNCFCDSVRRQQRRRTEPLESAPPLPAEPETSRDFENDQLWRAIAELPEKERTVTLLFYMEEKSLKEITAITGINPATVRSHLHRARRHLQKILKTFENI